MSVFEVFGMVSMFFLGVIGWCSVALIIIDRIASKTISPALFFYLMKNKNDMPNSEAKESEL